MEGVFGLQTWLSWQRPQGGTTWKQRWPCPGPFPPRPTVLLCIPQQPGGRRKWTPLFYFQSSAPAGWRPGCSPLLPLPVLPNPEGFAKALETHTVSLTVRTGLTSQVASEMDMGAERREGPHLFPPSPLLPCSQGLSHKTNETGRLCL